MKKISLYVTKIFLSKAFSTLLFFALIVFFVKFIENQDNFSEKPEIVNGLRKAALVSLVQIPAILSEIIPFLFVIVTVRTLFTLQRNNELIAAQSLGFSSIRICLPILFMSALLGAGYYFYLYDKVILIDNFSQNLYIKYYYNDPNYTNKYYNINKSHVWVNIRADFDEEFKKSHNLANMNYLLMRVKASDVPPLPTEVELMKNVFTSSMRANDALQVNDPVNDKVEEVAFDSPLLVIEHNKEFIFITARKAEFLNKNITLYDAEVYRPVKNQNTSIDNNVIIDKKAVMNISTNVGLDFFIYSAYKDTIQPNKLSSFALRTLSENVKVRDAVNLNIVPYYNYHHYIALYGVVLFSLTLLVVQTTIYNRRSLWGQVGAIIKTLLITFAVYILHFMVKISSDVSTNFFIDTHLIWLVFLVSILINLQGFEYSVKRVRNLLTAWKSAA